MAKPNYQFEKRQKEIAKRNKKEEKRQKKAEGNAAVDDSSSKNPTELMSPGTSGGENDDLSGSKSMHEA